MLKLDHKHLQRQLATHFNVDEHWSPHLACGFAEGLYSMLESVGFKRWESHRVIVEHLRPGFHAERMTEDQWRGAPYNNPLLSVWLHLQIQERSETDNDPFCAATEDKIRALYADADHSEKFWSVYEKEWLPRHEEIIEARRPPSSFLGRVLKALSRI